jgi:MFS family permease
MGSGYLEEPEMDATPRDNEGSSGPISAITAAVQDGIGRYRALSKAPESRRLLLALAGTRIGYRFNTVALVAISYRLGDGALGVGGMLAILLLPSFVIQPLAGNLVDRNPGKRLLILAQIAMALIAVSFILLTVFPSIWLLYALTLTMGIIQTVDMPAFEVRLMSLTPRELRGTANAVQMLSITAGEIIGPVIGGIFLALVGANSLFITQALLILVFARVVAILPERVAGATAEPEADEAETATASSRGPGYLSLMRRSDVRLYAGLVAGSYLLYYGTVPLYIVRANELGLGDGSVGLFYTVMGIGTLFGGILAGMGSYSTNRALGIAGLAAIVGAISVILFGAAGTLVFAIPALILFGMIGDIEEISAMTYFQNRLPEHLYGRFFSLFMMAASIGGLIGALAGPLLAKTFSTSAAVAALAVPVILLGATFGIKEGGLRLALPPFAPQLEPEVAGHGLFGRTERMPLDLVGQRMHGKLVLEPRTSRLV